MAVDFKEESLTNRRSGMRENQGRVVTTGNI